MIAKRTAVDQDEIRRSEGLRTGTVKVGKIEFQQSCDVEGRLLISPRACVAYPAAACVRSLQEKFKMTMRRVQRLFQSRAKDQRMAGC